MKKILNGGLYPAMITPYDENGNVDYEAIEKIVDWYAQRKVGGIFAVCQSSEMFFLTLEEREKIARAVVNRAPDDVDVVVSGIVGETIEEQIKEIDVMKNVGARTVVLITNRLAKEDEDDETLWSNLEIIFKQFPDVTFGLYECPYPYKRLLSDEIIKRCAQSGRIDFIKDTCCSFETVKRRIEISKGSKIRLYNANTATLLDTVYEGAAGISGVMGNFHPELYAKMFELCQTDRETAEKIQNILSTLSIAECQNYPANAKYYLKLEGLPIRSFFCRSKNIPLTESMKREIDSLYTVTGYLKEYIG